MLKASEKAISMLNFMKQFPVPVAVRYRQCPVKRSILNINSMGRILKMSAIEGGSLKRGARGLLFCIV